MLVHRRSSLFSARLEILKDFIALSQALRKVGMHWRLPLVKWAEEEGCPKQVRDFIRRARAFDVGSDIFISPFAPVEIDGHREDLSIELDYERGGKADAFPLRVGRIGQDGVERRRTVLFPLGLEALIEGSAHAFSRTFVGHYFQKSVSVQLEQRFKRIIAQDGHGRGDQRVAQTMTPYMVTDLLITRFLRRHNIPTFPRDLVLALTDRVLSTSVIRVQEQVPGTTEIHIDRVGGKLVDILQGHNPQDLGAGSLSDAPEVTAVYQSLLSAFEQGGDWQTVDDNGSALSSIAIWESYLAQHFIVPLLRERLATNHRAFTSYEGFLALLPKIGMPPARVANGVLILEIMPRRVQQAWWHQMMLGEILRQLIRGDGRVFCPRAHALVPGVITMNLALEGDCQQNLRLGCGTFRPAHAATRIPKCLFESGLQVCALERQ